MAMIVPSVARLKPEIRLADAISRFEASLSSDQKIDFCKQRTNALSSPPGPSDVMRFTGDIDRCMKTGRCLGPRFTNFMQGVQQFAALGDVIVGGSQNIIACGVWALVRTSILAVVSFNSYIEKVSLVVMEIGRSIPRHQEMALLYPRSDALQAHINEYFIVVVEFCQNFIAFAEKSKIQKLASTLSEAKIKATQSDLKSWAHEIGEEVRLLMAKRIEEEAEQNSRFRTLSKRFSKTFLLQQEVAAKLRILKQCSQHDHETAWKQIRKIGNTQRFLDTSPYEDWKTQNRSSTLLYLGILGCGKSVMMANIVDDLNAYTKDKEAFVIYFFIRQDLPESLKARTVIGSVVRQLLQRTNGFAKIMPSNEPDFDSEAMLSLLKGPLAPKQQVYLVLDGLHMASYSDRRAIVDFLQKLQEQCWLLVCASYRQEPNVSLDTTLRMFKSAVEVPMPDNHSDIEAFIETELTCRLESGALKLGDAALILKIQDALLTGSKNMFLWVALQIETICTLQTDEEIRDALEDLPYDLGEIYHQLLRRQREPENRYQQRIFELITAAQRPLTTSEFREALSVSAGDTTWTASKLLHDVYSVLATCGCLIRVDEEELTVRFMHPTVGQFFLARFHDSDGNLVTLKHCHQVMTEIIVTYLSYGVFETEVSTFRVPQINVGAAPSKVIRSTMESTPAVQSLALKLLKRRKQPNFDIGKMLAEELHMDRQPKVIVYHFQYYAYPYCIFHVGKTQDMKKGTSKLLLNLLKKNNGSGYDHLTCNEAWSTAVDNNHLPLVRLIVENRSELIYEVARPLSRALCRGQDDILHIVLEDLRKEDFNEKFEFRNSMFREEYMDLPCLQACFGETRALQKCIDRMRLEGKSRHVCLSGRSPIACAIVNNETENLKLLLTENDREWNINYGLYQRTPIREAVERGYEDSLRILLSTKKVILGYGEQDDLVRLARENGHHRMVHILESSRLFAAAPAAQTWKDGWEEKQNHNHNQSPEV